MEATDDSDWMAFEDLDCLKSGTGFMGSLCFFSSFVIDLPANPYPPCLESFSLHVEKSIRMVLA